MIEYGLPVLFALFIWWFSTGVILYLDGLPRRSFRWSMLGATVLLAAGLYGLWWSREDASIGGAFIAFTCGLLVWGWHEISFLTGLVTGPRKTPCPAGSSGWRRFIQASETIIHHEIAIAATAGLILALTWGGANQTGMWTFVVLWLMRLSTKLNIFLGVPNLTEEFLPAHLHYLKTYFRRSGINPLFPVSVSVSTIVTTLIAMEAVAPAATPYEAASATFLATLMALAVLEHWLLVLPLPDVVLWKWALTSRKDETSGCASDGDMEAVVVPVKQLKVSRLEPPKRLETRHQVAENEAGSREKEGLKRFYSSIAAHRAPKINWR